MRNETEERKPLHFNTGRETLSVGRKVGSERFYAADSSRSAHSSFVSFVTAVTLRLRFTRSAHLEPLMNKV